jgi:hypothetical protein
LGATSITFATTGGSVVESLPEFSGSAQSDPCNFCEVDTVGFFSIPSDALPATGTFGNSVFPNRAGGDIFLGPFTPTATPLPTALPLFATGIGGLGLLGWDRKRKAQAVAWFSAAHSHKKAA